MKQIPILKSNQQLLCDDEDYELLAKYRWHFWKSNKRRQLIAEDPMTKRKFSPLHIIYGFVHRAGYVPRFRDGNACNYQRYNLVWRDNVEERLRSSVDVPHCPLGPAVLRPKTSEGRSACCFICLDEDYDSYYQCLDIVAHKTYWKGWIRHDA